MLLFWVSVSALIFALFHRLFFRIQTVEGNESKNSNSNCAAVPSQGSKPPCLSGPVVEDEGRVREAHVFQVEKSDADVSEENESPNFFFKFQYQTKSFEEFSRVYQGSAQDICFVSLPSTSTSKYGFSSEHNLGSSAENLSFGDGELSSDSKDAFSPPNGEINEDTSSEGFGSGKDMLHQNSKDELVPDQTSETSDDKVGQGGLVNEEAAEMDKKLSSGKAVSEDFRFLSVKDFNALDSDLDSLTSSYERRSRFTSSTTDGFLSDRDFEDAFDLTSSEDMEGEKERLSKEYLDIFQDTNVDHQENEFDDEDEALEQEYRELVESQNANDDSNRLEARGNDNGRSDSKKSGLDNPSASDSEDSAGLETLWEHQDLIEQLKLELKKVRATGLPTILEESEYPKIMEDLKPWKIDEKFHRENRMGELHKFYKSYREKMRKFDVLCYQKMYPLGLLPSKDALQLISSHKSSSAPAITSLIKQNFWLRKQKKSEELDEMMKYMRDLHSDLEAVYVGQLCLSWEILHWQYEKALEIWESDPYGIYWYNEVAGEFQQFQVLLQRFIENEPFEGPRVLNYINNRRAGLNFLQVPVIREDSSTKDKRKARRKGRDHDAITSDMLVEIMEESIRIFWKFIQADKDANVMTGKSRRASCIEPLDPEDLELLAGVQTSLLKKGKKLKEGLRGGNFILRKFHKHQEENTDQVLYFFSQVDLKLVGRVLSMSKITRDQLLWCSSKLSRISFLNRKIHVEPSFLLFPC